MIEGTPVEEQSTGDQLMGGTGDDTLTGSTGTDVLMGNDGHDTILGGEQDDKIVGGAGDDVMTGGEGADRFVFSPADGDGDDVIVDLNPTEMDRIDLREFELNGREQMELMENIVLRGEDVRIDLSDFGGGTILLQGTDVTLSNFGTLTVDMTALATFNDEIFMF